MNKLPAILLALSLSIHLNGSQLLFDATFDSGTAADHAVGKAECFSQGDTANPLADGLHKKAVRIGTWKSMPVQGTMDTKDMEYHWHYKAKGNIDYKKGAVSFWTAPADWEGTASPENKMLFHAACDNDAAYFIYKPASHGYITFHLKNYAKTAQVNICPVADWRKGEWHHIVYNWTDGNADFFVDGEHAASTSFPAFKREFIDFCIGNVGFPNEIGGSLMDDLKIFADPLTEIEIADIYSNAQVGRKAQAAKSTLGVGKCGRLPVLDGTINDGEYPISATGFTDFGTGVHREPYATYSMAHDGEWLYVAVKSSVADGYRKKPYARDGNLWEDESIELHLDVHGGRQYQFIINPLGNIYDSCDKDSSWNSESVRVACNAENGVWQCECAFKLAELGIVDKFGINIARSYKSPARLTCIANARAIVGYADPAMYFKTTLLPTAAPAVSLPTLTMDDDAFHFTARGLDKGKINVSLNFRNNVKTIASQRITLNGDEKSIVKSGLSGNSFAEIALSTDDGTVLYSHLIQMPKSNQSRLSLKYIYTDMDTDTVKFVLHRLSRHEPNEKLRIDFTTLDGKTVKNKTFDLGDNKGLFTLDFNASDLSAGFYGINGIHLMPNKKGKTIFIEAWRKPERHAIPDYFSVKEIAIQPPWSELTTSGSVVGCLGREYDFGGGILLKSLTSQGVKILADDMNLVIDGVAARPQNAAKPRLENHGAYCFVRKTDTYSGLQVSTESRVDYDGLVKVRLELRPPEKGVPIKSLQLAIPIDATVAEFVNGNNAYGKGVGQSRALAIDETWAENLYSAYLFWIGNSEIGLSLAFKNLRGWHCKDAQRSLVVRPEGKSRTVYLNIVDSPFVLNEPRTIEFAIMATPAKTAPQKLLRTRFCEWNMWSDHFSLYFDYPELPFLTDKTNADNAFHYNAFGTSPHSPDWNYYHKEWHNGTMGAVREDFHIEDNLENLKIRNRDQYVFGCFNTPSFLDFKLRQMDFILHYKPFNTKNLYFDLVASIGCASDDHGCAWTDDFGRSWGSMDWEGRRIYMQRVRQMLLKKNPNGLISIHSHNQRVPMLQSHCDIQVGGEDFVGEVGIRGNYYGIVNSEVLRSYSNAYGFGMKNVFIPQFERSLLFVKPGEHFDWNRPDNIKAGRHLLTMLFAHDIDPWAPGNPVAISIWNLEKSFGWDEQTFFVPKWKNDGLFAIKKDDSNDALVTGMFRRSGKALLAVVNDYEYANSIIISIDSRRILQKDVPSSVRPFFQPERRFRIANSSIETTLQPRDSEIFIIE